MTHFTGILFNVDHKQINWPQVLKRGLWVQKFFKLSLVTSTIQLHTILNIYSTCFHELCKETKEMNAVTCKDKHLCSLKVLQNSENLHNKLLLLSSCASIRQNKQVYRLRRASKQWGSLVFLYFDNFILITKRD